MTTTSHNPLGYVEIDGARLPIESIVPKFGGFTFRTSYVGPRRSIKGTATVLDALGLPVLPAGLDKATVISIPKTGAGDTIHVTYSLNVGRSAHVARSVEATVIKAPKPGRHKR